MNLVEKLKLAQNEAMRNKDVGRLSVIRLVRSAVEQTVTAGKERREATDIDVITAIRKEIAAKTETVENFQKLNRDTTALYADIATLESFLPQQMSDEQIRAVAEAIMTEKGLDKNVKSMGVILKELMARHQGQFDNAKASGIVKNMLIG